MTHHNKIPIEMIIEILIENDFIQEEDKNKAIRTVAENTHYDFLNLWTYYDILDVLNEAPKFYKNAIDNDNRTNKFSYVLDSTGYFTAIDNVFCQFVWEWAKSFSEEDELKMMSKSTLRRAIRQELEI